MRCGDIGEGQREIEFEPIREPAIIPAQPEPVPA